MYLFSYKEDLIKDDDLQVQYQLLLPAPALHKQHIEVASISCSKITMQTFNYVYTQNIKDARTFGAQLEIAYRFLRSNYTLMVK